MVRPRLRYLEVAEKNLRETKVKRRRQKTVDREEQAPVIKEAKAIRGLYSHGVVMSVRK